MGSTPKREERDAHLIYGNHTIAYSLLFSKRKTMEIAVHPDCTVVVKAPLDSEISRIEEKIDKRARWILKQLRYFQQFTPKTPVRKFIGGETHLYLGKQYRLKISKSEEQGVKLTRGYFQVCCPGDQNQGEVRALLIRWYCQKASIQFKDSLERCWPKFMVFDLPKPEISIRLMEKRWGSLSKKGTLTLNPELVKAPRECIDYVVTHELCHLKHHDHSSEFYNLLEQVIPDWQKIKHKLELTLS